MALVAKVGVDTAANGSRKGLKTGTSQKAPTVKSDGTCDRCQRHFPTPRSHKVVAANWVLRRKAKLLNPLRNPVVPGGGVRSVYENRTLFRERQLISQCRTSLLQFSH